MNSFRCRRWREKYILSVFPPFFWIPLTVPCALKRWVFYLDCQNDFKFPWTTDLAFSLAKTQHHLRFFSCHLEPNCKGKTGRLSYLVNQNRAISDSGVVRSTVSSIGPTVYAHTHTKEIVPGHIIIIMLWSCQLRNGIWRQILVWRLLHAPTERRLLQQMYHTSPLCYFDSIDLVLGRGGGLLWNLVPRSQLDTSLAPGCL